jgi:hypothetical protein
VRLAVVQVQVQRAVRGEQLARALQPRHEERDVVLEGVVVAEPAAAALGAGVERRVEVGHVEGRVGQRPHRLEVVALDQQVVVEGERIAGGVNAHRAAA